MRPTKWSTVLDAALPAGKPRFKRKMIAIIIVLIIVAVPSIVLLREATTVGTLPSVKISGSATAGSYGTAIAVVFLNQGNSNGMIGPVPFTSKVVDGRYNVTVPNHNTYTVLIDFQPPNGPSGTCSTVDINVNQAADNSSLTYNWSCFPPFQLATMTVNGLTYFADNVTNVMIAENPGTFHFNNGSVTFLGVQFQTICTDYASECPGVPPPAPGAIFVGPSGAGITLNVAFPDHSSEMITGGFPLVPVYFYTFSHHTNPQAGILIVYTSSSPSYKSYLLVSVS